MNISPLRIASHGPTRLILTVLFGLALLAPLPYVVVRPSTPENVMEKLISISGAPTFPVQEGSELFITAVLVSDPQSYVSGFEVLKSWLSGSSAVFPRAEIYPPTQSNQEISAENKAEMTNSQNDATAAALNFLGYQLTKFVTLSGTKSSSDSHGQLMAKDRILEIDGQKISTSTQIHSIITRHKMGDALPVLVQRTSQSGSTQNLTFDIKLTPNEAGDPALGIYVQNSYEFPFTVKFNIDKTGGPSGGLVFALGIIEKLTSENLLKGRKIAGTGTIDSEGNVGPIGGITEKMIGASQAGATIFLAPAKNCVDIKHVPKNLLVIPVSTLSQAVTVLRNTNPEAFAGCR
mgnify:FL=1